MITTKELKTLEDFQNIKKGDFIACEFHRNIYMGKNPQRSGVFEVFANKDHTHEIILNKKWNIYFNYNLFLTNDGGSNLISAVIVKITP